MNAKIDLTPAEPFLQRTIGKFEEDDAFIASLGLTTAARIGRFSGVGPFPSKDDAVRNFNTSFASWCGNLPAGTLLAWKLHPCIVQETNFKTDALEWRIACGAISVEEMPAVKVAETSGLEVEVAAPVPAADSTAVEAQAEPKADEPTADDAT